MKVKNFGVAKKITLMMVLCILLSIILIVSITILSIRKIMYLSMDNNARKISRQVIEQIGVQAHMGEEAEKKLEDDLYNAAYSIAYIENYTNELLQEISKDTKIAEINIVSDKGIIIFSNMEDNLHYEYNEDHAIQGILKGQTIKLVEKVRKSTVDNKLYKYAAIKIPNRNLALQIGMSAEYVESINGKLSVQNVITSIRDTEDIEYIRITDKDGIITESTSEGDIGRSIEASELEALVQAESGISKISFDKLINKTVYMAVVPIQDSAGELTGIINVGVSMKSISNSVQDILLNAATIILVVFTILLIVTVVMARRITRPIIKLSKYAECIADGDLTVKEEIKLTNDEIGKLVTTFNYMIDNLKNIVKGILNTSNDLSETSCQVTTSTKQVVSVSEQIAASTDEIAKGSYEQVRITGDARSNAVDIDKSIRDLNDGIKLIRSKADTMIDMSSISKRDMSEMSSQIDSIMQSSTISSNTIKELIDCLNKIDSITDVINSIASQTNLLALNASIEAARAGENGRGFAVVADEVKKLAEESLQSAKSITQLIQQTQQKSSQTIAAIDESVEQSLKGQQIVGRVEKSLEDIITSIEAIAESFGSYEAVNKEVKTQTEAFIKQVENIEEISQRASESTQEVAASTEKQVAALQQAVSAIEDISSKVEQLRTMSNRFKL